MEERSKYGHKFTLLPHLVNFSTCDLSVRISCIVALCKSGSTIVALLTGLHEVIANIGVCYYFC